MSQPSLTVCFSREQIAEQVARLAKEIAADYPDREVLLIGVLKGSMHFVSDLARALPIPVKIDFVRLASYGAETFSSGVVEFRKDLEMPIRDRDVIIVEDIVDSGNTLELLYHHLQLRQPRTLRICTLINKTGRRQGNISPDYVGLTMADGFVVGYGLDFDENFRNLPDIHLVAGV